ncbi:MAG: protein kinase [Clostridia bacterium]|nr:protein kinase [Clostridia bacterium]
MIGRLISGRYRIEAVVGTGGMAVVYRALDIQENRTVAIKVLRREYESDMEFVRRFSREAEAAAKMSHDNIVNLLDVGIEGETRYIVMEFVDGQTLKEMIRIEGRIHPDVALRMTIRILAAVDHAHRNGIVHRDIKPQNILVDLDGRVKVADFGIARLKASQTTKIDANGSAMGSVHYLSPEQARGEVADEQSDLYSVGVVLYEMLTGRVPFDGDTTVSVALKHVNEEPRSMRSHSSHISRALDEVVMRALCKDKKRRYQSAAEMAADLRMTISRPKGGFVKYPKVRETTGEIPLHEESKKKKGRKKKTRAAAIAAVVLVLACALALTGLHLQNKYGGVKMPALIGLEEAPAVQALESQDINVTVVTAYSDQFAEGVVMLQSRDAGETLRKTDRITLTVSLGSQWYYLENMAGWDAIEAETAARESGANTVEIDYVQSDLPVGMVVSMDLEAGWVSRDTPVTLKVSGQTVSVPSLSGLSFEGALAVIQAEGLVLGTVSEGESADAESGTVIAQSIAPYTQVLVNTAVDLTICREQAVSYALVSPLTVVIPLDQLELRIDLVTPSGQSFTAYSGVLAQGTHSVELLSHESGTHAAYVYLDEVLFESMQLDFE